MSSVPSPRPYRTSFKFTFKFKFEYSRRSLEGPSKPWLRPHAVNPVNVIDLVLNFSSLFLLLYSSFFFLRSSPASQPARRTAVARAHRGLHFDFDGFPSLSTSSQTSLCIFDCPRPRRRSLARLSRRVLCLLARRLHRRPFVHASFSRHPAPIHTLLRSTRSRKASRPRLPLPHVLVRTLPTTAITAVARCTRARRTVTVHTTRLVCSLGLRCFALKVTAFSLPPACFFVLSLIGFCPVSRAGSVQCVSLGVHVACRIGFYSTKVYSPSPSVGRGSRPVCMLAYTAGIRSVLRRSQGRSVGRRSFALEAVNGNVGTAPSVG